MFFGNIQSFFCCTNEFKFNSISSVDKALIIDKAIEAGSNYVPMVIGKVKHFTIFLLIDKARLDLVKKLTN